MARQLNDPAYAEWISAPGIKGDEYGVFYFRKSFDLQNNPKEFIVHVSADNRYRLFVNGKMVSWGPAVGDLNNWFYETVDIASHLKTGKNIVSAQVWNFGPYKGARQVSNKTAFILKGNSSQEQIINSDETWKVTIDKGYYPLNHTSSQIGGGYIAGATDSVDAVLHPWNWNLVWFSDDDWRNAKKLGKGNHSGLNTWYGTPWLLKPRMIPSMELIQETTPKVLQIEGLKSKPEELSLNFNFIVPDHSKVTLLLDNEKLTMGFPNLKVSKGKGAKIIIQYQEALFDLNNGKGNRNEWKNKTMKGYYDVFLCDGGANRLFEPLWIRVFRYVKIEIETQDEPLDVHDFHNVFTAYPFQQKASFTCNDKSMDKIWDVSWHTVRLCALESYMDCPYYEQVQYIGDTRIQALISMYITGDSRLVRNAIDQFNNSIQPWD
ncbi:MAG: family 78 glycoside hydrolase catalytic domain [Bacteroidales bacterium]|nr:family 78 glycoside hydrolase catalytic domain [Bacteroidales bacterium]